MRECECPDDALLRGFEITRGGGGGEDGDIDISPSIGGDVAMSNGTDEDSCARSQESDDGRT